MNPFTFSARVTPTGDIVLPACSVR